MARLSLRPADAQLSYSNGTNPRDRLTPLLSIPIRWLCQFWKWLSEWLLVWMEGSCSVNGAPRHPLLTGGIFSFLGLWNTWECCFLFEHKKRESQWGIRQGKEGYEEVEWKSFPLCHLFFSLKIFLSDMSITGHILKTAAFWDVSWCNPMEGHKHLGRTYCLLRHGSYPAELLSRSALCCLFPTLKSSFHFLLSIQTLAGVQLNSVQFLFKK